jgi:beta-barrel assembly-enhancing protease
MRNKLPGACLAGLLWLAAAAVMAGPTQQQIVDANREETRLNAGTNIVKDAELEKYLTGVVQRLVAADATTAATEFRVRVLNSVAPYVFCLDNGAIYVSTGLLARLQNEAQLSSLLATELTPVVRGDSAQSEEVARKRAKQSAIPNILLVAVTAGLAAFPLTDADNKAREKVSDQLRLDSDRLAVTWLQRAGVDLAEMPRAYQRLLETLQAEGRFGIGTLSSKSGLEGRLEEIKQAMPADLIGTAAAATAPDAFQPIARRFALALVRTDLGNSGSASSLIPVLDRFEREFGAGGESSFIRAQFSRLTMKSPEQMPDVILKYQNCAAHADAPAEAFRELGFLYRKQGDAPNAKQSFATYLERAPSAVDAPIIRSYMEKL